MKTADKALGESKTWRQRCSDKEKEIDDAEVAVKSIIAGRDERLNWLMLNQFVSECLPRMDGTNLTPEQIKRDWEPRGKAAFEMHTKRIGGAKEFEATVEDDEGVDELVQTNVESYVAMYTDELEKYFDKLKASPAAKNFQDMVAKDRDTSPKGPGWVGEIRGYTYHKDRGNFVIATLLENLKTKPPTFEPKLPERAKPTPPNRRTPNPRPTSRRATRPLGRGANLPSRRSTRSRAKSATSCCTITGRWKGSTPTSSS